MVEQPQTMEQPSSSNQQHSSSSQQSKIKKRISRKERARDVKTPDPSFGPSSSSPLPEELEQQQEQHPRPRSRPSTPRQARAPSPEERPLVVPLPPPRMQDPSPVRKAQQQHQQQDMVVVPPALPPRPSSTPPRSQPPQDVVVDPKQPPPHQVVVQQQQAPPPPPPRHQSAMDKESFAQAVSHQPMSELTKDVINDIKKPPTNTNDNTTTSTTNDKLKQRMIDEEEEKRFAKQMESTIPAEMVEVVNLNQPELYEVEPLIMKDYLPPSLVHAKEAANSGIQSSSVAVEMFHPETAVMPEKKQQPTVPNPSTATSIISKAFEPPQTNTQTIPPESSLKKQSKNIVSSLTRQEQEEDMMMEEKHKKNQKIAEQEQPNTELNKSNIKPSSNVMKIVNSAQHSVASTESSTSKPNNKLHEASSEAVVIAKSEVLQQPVQKQNSKTVGNVPANSSEAMIPSSSITAATSRSSKRNEEIPQGSSSISSTSDSSSGKVVEAAAVGALLMQQPQDLKSVPIADTTTATNAAYVETTTSMTQATNTASVERLKDNNNECNNANVGMTKNDNNDADARCLINSMPKPFKSNIPEENSTELETQRQIEVLANAALLEQEAAEENINNDNIVATKSTPINTTTTSTSSDPNNPPPSTSTPNSNSSHSPSPSAMVSRQNSSQNSSPQNQSPQPMYHLLHRPEKRDNRDSKVFKAAAYWNNHVSEVMEKKKLPDNVKSLEKPKKITSAGVGPRGYENLKSAFEQNRLNNNNSNGTNLANPDDVNNNNNGNNIVSANGGIMQRRNSRKIAPVEGCTPGLKVTDAKSVFEMKSQQSPTPVLYRRNSSMSSGDNSKINSSITKGKESADEVIGGQDQQPTTTRTTSNGPNYIKKKVPEFPPQPQQPLATTKTPFGNAALRRHGALSPRTVLNTTTSSDLETTATNKLPTTPEAIVTKAPPKFNKPQQQAQAPQSIDSSTVDNTNSSDLLSSSTSKPSATQKIKISVQENHPTLAMNEVNGHIEKDMATPKLKNVEKASNTIAAPKTPIEENSANSSKPEQSNSKLDQIAKKPDKASSGPVLTIKGISKEEGVLATMTSIPSSSDEQQKKNNNISRKEVLKEPLNKVDNFANQQKPLQPADSKTTNDNTTEAQQPATNRNLISHQKVSKHEPVKHDLIVPTATKAEKTSNLEIPKQKITDKPLVPDKSPVLSKKKDKAVISNKENLDKTTFASPVPTTSTTTTTSSKVVSDPIPKDNIEIPKSSIANIKSSKDTIIPANETISGTPAFRSIKIDKEEPSMSVTSPSTQKTSSKSTTADNTILTTPETLEIPVERAKDNINKPAPLRIIPIQIEQTNNNLSSGVASNLEQPSITNEDIRISSPNPVSNNRQEHHIPIHVEGKGTIINNNNNLLDSSAAEMAAADLAETRDSFSTNSLSRRRFGSRKKRISSAYSDSSMTSAEDEAQAAAAASENPGLQKYTSIGKQTKHGEPMFRLRKTRPPFAAQRSDSFSSDEDDFDDDGFREMTAENLFSTLLTRVKSLTRRIHDDHDLEGPGSSQIMRGSGGGTGGGSSSSSGFQQNHGIINHRLNPGNTHARLERSALRNSLKRSTNNNTPTAGLSRQSSMDASLRTSLRDSDIMSAAATSLAGFEDGSSMRSFGSHGGTGAGGDLTRGGSSNQQRGITTSTTNDDIISSKLDSTNQYSSGGANIQGKEEQSMSKRYIDLDLLNIHGNSSSGKTEQPSAASTTENCTNVSVTSKQRLRPGYLPPPSHLASDQTDSTSHDTRIEHALSESSSLKNLISSSTTTTGTTARHIPINVEIQQQQSDRNITLGSSNLSSTSLASGPSMTDMLESISEKNNSVASNSGNRQSKEDLQQNSNNRRQSYLQDEESMFKSLKTMGSGGNSSSSKSVPLKRLSGNFDSLQENNNPENENSSSSGYYSNQHQQLKHHPRNPTSKKTMEGQSSLTKSLTESKQTTAESTTTTTTTTGLQLPSITTSTASFTSTASSSINSSSNVSSNINIPSSSSGPSAATAPMSPQPILRSIQPVISSLSPPSTSISTSKLPLPPSQLPSMSHVVLVPPSSVSSSISNTSSPIPIYVPEPSTVTSPSRLSSTSYFFPSSPPTSNTPSMLSPVVSSSSIVKTSRSSGASGTTTPYSTVLTSPPTSPPMSPPPILRHNNLKQSPTQKLLLEQQQQEQQQQQKQQKAEISSSSSNKLGATSTDNPTKPKITQPIYTPFKNESKQTATSPPASSSNSENPFQKKVRNQPSRPYLQVALVQDRIHRSQLQAASKMQDATDDNISPIGGGADAANSKRRTILPYGGAKSDGLLNKHAFISSNIIAAAERRKRDTYSRSSTTELFQPMEKVIESLISTLEM